MTEDQAIAAAAVLIEAGMFDAASDMEERAEFLRKQRFQDRAERMYDDPDFALAMEADRMEGF